MEDRCVSLVIHGRVQGVFYRASARTAGAKLGLRGWVWNRYDGTVEAIAGGPSVDIESYIAWCHKGPPAANVARIELRGAEDDGSLGTSFDVREDLQIQSETPA
jgi:acylphosphatase